jgi:hypothetical protein
MAVEYTWQFPQFDVAKAEDGLSDVVKTIHWRLDAVDGEFKVGAYGTVALDAPDPDAFTPYATISPDWAVAAVEAKLERPVDEIKAAMEAEIERQKDPPILPMVPPFAALAS